MIIRTFEVVEPKNPNRECYIRNRYKTETEMCITELADTFNSICVEHYFDERAKRKLMKLYDDNHRQFFIEMQKLINKIIEKEY